MNQNRISKTSALLSLIALLFLAAQAEEPKLEAKFFGKGFFNYSHDFSSTARGAGSGQTNGFDFTRIYFGYDRDLNQDFGIRVLFDADYAKEYKVQPTSSTTMDTLIDTGGDSVFVPITTTSYALVESKKTIRAFVKNAYLSMNCKLVKGSKWYFGMIGMPFVGVPEQHWGYRSIYQLAMDKQGWGSTADLGIGWKGMWQDMFQLEFALANGAGFREPEADMFKLIELRPAVYLLEKALTLSAFVSYETWNKDASALIYSAMGGYDHKFFRIGAEYSARSFSDSAQVTLPDNSKIYTESQYNLSFWGHLKPTEKLTLLARYDVYEPNTDADKDKVSQLIVGLDFHPAKNVHFIPNVQMEMYERDDIASTPVDESAAKNTAFVSFEYSW